MERHGILDPRFFQTVRSYASFSSPMAPTKAALDTWLTEIEREKKLLYFSGVKSTAKKEKKRKNNMNLNCQSGIRCVSRSEQSEIDYEQLANRSRQVLFLKGSYSSSSPKQVEKVVHTQSRPSAIKVSSTIFSYLFVLKQNKKVNKNKKASKKEEEGGYKR